MSLIGHILRFFLERSARNKSYTDLSNSLQSSEMDVKQRILAAADTTQNRRLICHIIGIERWGQRRLQTALGESLLADEHDAYCPDAALDCRALVHEFSETRRQSLALAKKLQKRKVPRQRKVPHNDMGTLSVGAWLSYLNGHAAREARRIRGKEGQ